MKFTLLEKAALGLAGAMSISIGMFIAVAPHSFYFSQGIVLGSDPNLLSELRAPGAGLAGFGVLMLMGIWRSELTPLSRVLALTVFLSFPAGRIVGLIVDGLPSNQVIGALVIELVIAGLCIVAFGRRSQLTFSPQSKAPVQF